MPLYPGCINGCLLPYRSSSLPFDSHHSPVNIAASSSPFRESIDRMSEQDLLKVKTPHHWSSSSSASILSGRNRTRIRGKLMMMRLISVRFCTCGEDYWEKND